MSAGRILLIDDDPSIRFGVSDFLESHGFEVDQGGSCTEGERLYRAARPDAVVLDYSLPDGTALELLPRLRAFDPGVPVVILTGHGSIELAVQAIKLGAEQFLTKPIELAALLSVLERLLENQRARQRDSARRGVEAREEIDPFAGASPAIRRLEEDARRVAEVDTPVLLQGETGSGKGVLARWIHRNGRRREEEFVNLNCAGLSREFLETELFGHEKGAFTGAVARKIGLLEVGNRGTVFLDEIGDVDPAVQPKLLKVLEEKRFRRLGDVRDRTVEIRLVAATHQDLGKLVQEQRFRSDLYFRISTFPLRVPPLRERREDIEPLAEALLRKLAVDLGKAELSLAPAALRELERYTWPGNVRELRNVLERAALLAAQPELGAADLRFEGVGLAAPTDESDWTLAGVERRHIERVLQLERGRVTRAAERLGVPRSTLYEKLRQLGLAFGQES
jgi:DNA-binding NtrC family response regulator